jgi:LysM repeat protein
MKCFSAQIWCAALILLPAFLGGCLPGETVDEEKDPHYQRGRSLSGTQDFKGAVAEFEKALETNPHSGAAHFELGWLFDDKIKDSAAAIYHYQRFLSLSAASDRSDRVKERIKLCKQELAKSEFSLPNTQNFQRELDRLNAENTTLKQQVESLQTQLRNRPNDSHTVPAPIPRPRETPWQPGQTPVPTPLTQPEAPRTRAHVIKAGDTLESVAKQYGLKTSSVQAANPQVDPRKLRPGQSLNLP